MKCKTNPVKYHSLFHTDYVHGIFSQGWLSSVVFSSLSCLTTVKYKTNKKRAENNFHFLSLKVI